MLKITVLRKAMEAAVLALNAEYAACPSHATPRELELEKLAAAARAAYYAEFDKARALRAQYEAMPDDDANGSTNAGDTFHHADHGDERFDSTEYWQCAIDSAQMMNDEAAAIAKREAERAADELPAVELHVSADYCAATPRDQWASQDHAWVVEGEGCYFGSFAGQSAAEACARENVAEFKRLGQHATYLLNA